MPEENLTTIEEGIRHVQRRQAGERSEARAPTDEAVGDPDEGSPQVAGEAGAAAGVVAGGAIAGPIGMAAGAAIGAAAGAAAEGDEDTPATHDAERKARNTRNGGTTMTDRKNAGSAELDRDRDADEDPGAYIGRMPEREAETIPGGISDKDERVAAHSTQVAPTAGDVVPSGHRDGPPVTDDTIREAGQNR